MFTAHYFITTCAVERTLCTPKDLILFALCHGYGGHDDGGLGSSAPNDAILLHHLYSLVGKFSFCWEAWVCLFPRQHLPHSFWYSGWKREGAELWDTSWWPSSASSCFSLHMDGGELSFQAVEKQR